MIEGQDKSSGKRKILQEFRPPSYQPHMVLSAFFVLTVLTQVPINGVCEKFICISIHHYALQKPTHKCFRFFASYLDNFQQTLVDVSGLKKRSIHDFTDESTSILYPSLKEKVICTRT